MAAAAAAAATTTEAFTPPTSPALDDSTLEPAVNVPEAGAVTFAETVHDADAATLPPERVIVPAVGSTVTEPVPHVVDAAGRVVVAAAAIDAVWGTGIVSPDGRVPVNPSAVVALALAGLVIVKVNVEVAPGVIVVGENCAAKTGTATGSTVASVVCAPEVVTAAATSSIDPRRQAQIPPTRVRRA